MNDFLINTAVILAGGRGSRISELTGEVPKPLLMVGDAPIFVHIMRSYLSIGIRRFILPVGYLGTKIMDYVNTQMNLYDTEILVIDTGLETQTGGRIGRLAEYLPPVFHLTYGDGISNVKLLNVESMFFSRGSAVTLTAVNPIPRFGSLQITHDSYVSRFSEKSVDLNSWINGGFMVVKRDAVLPMIESDSCNLEKDILPKLAEEYRLTAYKHFGFWHCIDTLRDLQLAEELYKDGVF